MARGVTTEHSAAMAWRDLFPHGAAPDQVAFVHDEGKSQIYRLSGVGPPGSAVVAKRCYRDGALVERRIYEQVLPRLPISTLRYFGFVEEENSEFCWLFLEDAGDEPYSRDTPEHRILAARWLGALHSRAAESPAANRFADRGPGYYWRSLQWSRQRIAENIAGNGDLQAQDLELLKTVLSQLDALELRWKWITGVCEAMPLTLVHGDFVAKNVRVRTGITGSTLLVMDWETVGWGVPAVDLAQYVGPRWPHVGLHDIEQLASIGKIFRIICAVRWASECLRPDCLKDAVGDMKAARDGWLPFSPKVCRPGQSR